MSEEQQPAAAPAWKPLPRYQCHKVVEAAVITDIARKNEYDDSEGVTLRVSWMVPGEITINGITHPSEAQVSRRIDVDGAWVAKHEPQIGGYFVLYEDGYRSYSPKEAFEAGYTRIGPVVSSV